MTRSKRQETQGNGIAARIRTARERAQLEPTELREALAALGLDVSKTGLHRLETQDPKNPNLSLIEAIASITNVSPSWILFGEGATTKPDEFGQAIRSRVVDTIELLVGALDLTTRQESTINNWMKSVRESKPTKLRKP
ncbi:MAG: helix-turn-helix transcriptional regulator [Pseudomonadota bacterium]